MDATKRSATILNCGASFFIELRLFVNFAICFLTTHYDKLKLS